MKPVWNEQVCSEQKDETVTFSTVGIIPPPGVTVNADLSLTIAPTKADWLQITTFDVIHSITVFSTALGLEEILTITQTVNYQDECGLHGISKIDPIGVLDMSRSQLAVEE